MESVNVPGPRLVATLTVIVESNSWSLHGTEKLTVTPLGAFRALRHTVRLFGGETLTTGLGDTIPPGAACPDGGLMFVIVGNAGAANATVTTTTEQNARAARRGTTPSCPVAVTRVVTG
jgi:hypothetical protein